MRPWEWKRLTRERIQDEERSRPGRETSLRRKRNMKVRLGSMNQRSTEKCRKCGMARNVFRNKRG